MNISISGHHISITDALRDAVNDKLSKVERHFDQIQSIKVVLSVENSSTDKKSHKAEALMRVSGQEMFVQADADDMYKAINSMADKLDRQVRKYKTRMERNTRPSKRNSRHDTMVEEDIALNSQTA